MRTMIESSQENSSSNDEVRRLAKENRSPLQAAADLIQTLDKAQAEMNSCAASAARDAEDARRNARAASEIARRYQNRSYPKLASPFGSAGPSTPRSPSFQFERTVNGDESPARSRPLDASYELNGSENGHLRSPSRRDEITLQLPGSSGRKRKPFKAPSSSSERLAQSHAEDVLSLSLELERSKQAVKEEQRAHAESKMMLAALKAKNSTLEEQMKKLQNDLEIQQEHTQHKVVALEKELDHARVQIEAAEEDAQLALDLAKDNSDRRVQVEAWLQQALEELETLRSNPSAAPTVNGDGQSSTHKSGETPRRSVRFADSPSVADSLEGEMKTPEPRKSGPSRAMVAAGRQLLRRSLAESDEETVHALELTPVKSAERRQKLQERLRDLEDVDVQLSSIASDAGSDSVGNSGIPTSRLVEERHAVFGILQKSGNRLDLGGYWLAENGESPTPDFHLDVVSQQFCQAVEFKIERKSKEVDELECLCGYLEQMLRKSDDN